MDPKPQKTIFCENDSKDDTLDWCEKFPLEKEIISFKLGPVKRGEGNEWRYLSIGNARQVLLERARELDPDFAIFLDSDILVKSSDLIDIFTTWGLDIVGGCYIRDFPEGHFLATLFPNPSKVTRFKLYAKPRKALEEVEATSCGCLCLSRRVIQDRRLNFIPLREGCSEDFGFCHQARDLGYTIYLESLARLVHRIRLKAKKPWRLSQRELKIYRAKRMQK